MLGRRPLATGPLASPIVPFYRYGSFNAFAEIVEDADTITSTSAVRITALVALLEDADTVATTADLRIAAVSALIDADDSLNATSALRITSVVSLDEADDVGTSDAMRIITAWVDEVEDADTASGVIYLAAVERRISVRSGSRTRHAIAVTGKPTGTARAMSRMPTITVH